MTLSILPSRNTPSPAAPAQAPEALTLDAPPTTVRPTRRIYLSLAGLRDRLRYSQLEPEQHTDLTLRLLHATQLGELQCLTWAAGQRSLAEAAANGASRSLDAPPRPPVAVPPRPAVTTGHQRQDWAESYRANSQAEARHQGQLLVHARARQQLDDSTARVSVIDATIPHLQAQWQAWYYLQATYYQRGRTGLLGLIRRTPCQLAEYTHPVVPSTTEPAPGLEAPTPVQNIG